MIAFSHHSWLALALLWQTVVGLPQVGRDITTVDHSSGANRPKSYVPNYFDQPVDHFPSSTQYAPHTNATFKQRYFVDSTYYKPGGPVFLHIGGEVPGEARFDSLKTGVIQILMNATNGLGVILENRYYGESFPFESSTTDELRFLTTEQTIADNAYFAQHASFASVSRDLRAPKTPWILYGGSLAGAQTAFSIVEYGGASPEKPLWGGIAASAPIHAVDTYPEWYKPIQMYAPQDCISRLNNLVEKIDQILMGGNEEAIEKLKNIFGLSSLEDSRDFALTISFPLGGPLDYPTATWQELNWKPGYGSRDFFNFCDIIADPHPAADIVAVDNALKDYTNGKTWEGLGNYAQYIKQVLLTTCPSLDLLNTTTCFGTQNETFWADTTNSGSRSYLYSTCAESGGYQAAPASGPSLISQVLQKDYTQQWCDWAFPPGKHSSIPASPALETNNRYGDFAISAPRLAFIDGDIDPWKDLCVHSSAAPLRSGPDGYLMPGGGHHWDSYGILNIDAEPDFVRAAHMWEIRQVKAWLVEFEAQRKDEL